MKRVFAIGIFALLFTAVAQAAVINVPSGGDINAALKQAQPGDTIMLVPGGTYTGPVRLPVKPFGPTITITTSGTIPNRRITPQDAALLAHIHAVGDHAIVTDVNAANYRLDGLKVTSTHPEIVVLQDATSIVVDRLYIPGSAPTFPNKRGIRFNGKHLTVARSWIDNIRARGQDSQGIGSWDGSGPYTIVGNYIEAASENIIFGGSDSRSEAYSPADILVQGNHLFKPLAWKQELGQWNVKNLFELKDARRVKVIGNLMENNWTDAQAGTAVVLTPRNQGGTATWAVLEDVLFEGNVVRGTEHGFSITGYDNENITVKQSTRITLRNNLWQGDGRGRVGFISLEAGEVTIDRNTFINPPIRDSIMLGLYTEGTIPTPTSAALVPRQMVRPARIPIPAGGSRPVGYAAANLKVTSNLLQYMAYGVHSSMFAQGTATLTNLTKAFVWTNNVLGGGGGTYPATTTFLSVAAFAALTDPKTGLPVAGSLHADKGWSGPFPDVSGNIPAPADPNVTPVEPVDPGGATVLPLRTTITNGSCRLTVSADPPDTTGGWKAQFKSNGSNLGSGDSTFPYTRSATVPVGSYSLTVVWTKTGKPAMNSTAVKAVCQ